MDNARGLVESASAVFEKDQVGHAFGLLTLSAEELAKAWTYSEMVRGRVTLGRSNSPTVRSVKEDDFRNHRVKDEWFAFMVIWYTLTPLITINYWARYGPESPNFQGLDPEDYEAFVSIYMDMDPGDAALILDPTGKSAKRMDVLTTLSLRLGSNKNEGFYVGIKNGIPTTPSDISPEEYRGLRETIEWLLRESERDIRSAEPVDKGKSLAQAIRESIENKVGNDFLRDP